MRIIKAADLFCGGGGTSSGLWQACQAMGAKLELSIFATVCAAASLFIWWKTSNKESFNEEHDAYVASLWTGTIALVTIFVIFGIGLGLLLMGMSWLRSAVRP